MVNEANNLEIVNATPEVHWFVGDSFLAAKSW